MALAFDQHIHHAAALAWSNALPTGGQLCFCRYTQRGFLRLATNPKANPLQTQSLTDAWRVYDGLRGDPRVGYLPEPAGVEPHWRQFAQGRTFSHHVWNDAYLAAFAVASGCEVVTFDTAFTKFAGAAVTYLP